MGASGVAPPRKKASRRVTNDDKALVGEEFEGDLVEWQVLHVDRSEQDEAAVVFYYDLLSAESENITEEGMMSALTLEELEYYDCAERSSVAEIRRWIRDGGLARSDVHWEAGESAEDRE